ncbi:MAG: ACP S-malonyltransferase [Acholeplasmatales bacterium]|nr:ACP S-malonyltransferase [Acholeplasmatales bacterium]
MIAFLFAGQGSQEVGMGHDFYEASLYAKEVYDKFPEIRDICFKDENNILNETKNAQKCMLLTGYIISNILKEKGIVPTYTAGLSLGEYTALAFNNVWNLNDSIDIITKRGEIMQNALPLGTTKMAAILGLDRETILDAIKDTKGICEVANYNCPGQIVITGDNEGIKEGIDILSAKGAKRCIELNVSGAFHSSLLNNASNELFNELVKYENKNPDYKMVYNISGKEENKELNDILKLQIKSSVYFEDSIKYMIEKGVDTLIEIGPGKALSGFVKKIDRNVKMYNVSTYESLIQLLEELK